MKSTKLLRYSLCIGLSVLCCGLQVQAAGKADAGKNAGEMPVEFWSAPNQGQYAFWMQKAEAFNKAGIVYNGKTIKVSVQMMPETPSSEAGIQNALATGTAPAASENINRGFAATLAESGRLYDLKNDPLFKSIVDSRAMTSVLPGWEIKEGQYVIPLYANAMGYHWNVAGLKALGFESRVPETLDDIRLLVSRFHELKNTKLKELGISHLMMRPQLLRPEWWWDRWFDFQMQYLAFSGGQGWVKGSSLALDKAATVDVFEFFGLFGSSLQTAEDWTAFEQKQVPVLFQVSAPWDIPKYEAAGKKYGFDGDYVYGPPIVRNKGDKVWTFADSKGIVFYKGGNITDDQHNAVAAFVEWVFTGEVGVATDVEWIKTTGMLPVRGDLLTNPAFRSIIDENPAYAYQAAVMAFAVPAMAHPKMVDIQTALGEKGLTPYIQKSVLSASASPPSAEAFVDAAFAEMKKAGDLK